MGHFSKKKYLKLAKGFYGSAKRNPKVMIPKVHKSLMYAYVGRKLKKRNLRREWIHSINSGVREYNIGYGQFICGLNNSNIKLDRKILAGLSIYEPYSFKAIVDEVKIQGKIKEKVNPNKISMLEAYARKLIVDAPLRSEQADSQQRQLAEQQSMPYFFGERADVQNAVKLGLEKQAQIAKQLESIQVKNSNQSQQKQKLQQEQQK